MEYIYTGLIRFIDNAISTSKNIALYRGRYLISSLLEALSSIIFMFIVVNISNGNIYYTAISLALGSFLGKYIACLINDKFSKDITYTNLITSNGDNVYEIQKLYNQCLQNGIIAILFNSDDINNKPTKTLLIEAKTKEQSRVVDKFIEDSEKKFLRRIL